MYAVVNTGGKQYKIRKDEILRVEKIPGEVGAYVSFDRVLMFSDGENVEIGQPVLENMAVQGHIVEQGKAKKIIVFKYKRRKRYRRKQGHRQQYTAVMIDSIGGPGSAESETGATATAMELEQKSQIPSDSGESELEQKPAVQDREME